MPGLWETLYPQRAMVRTTRGAHSTLFPKLYSKTDGSITAPAHHHHGNPKNLSSEIPLAKGGQFQGPQTSDKHGKDPEGRQTHTAAQTIVFSHVTSSVAQ